MSSLAGWPCPACATPLHSWGCRQCAEPEREKLLAAAVALLGTEAVRRLADDARELGDPCHARNLLACVTARLAAEAGKNGRCRCGRVLETRTCGTCKPCLELEEQRGHKDGSNETDARVAAA